MPIHIFKSPDVVSPHGELVVEPGDTEFLPFTFNNATWLLGVHCLPDDSGGIVRDCMEVPISYVPGHEHADRLQMFTYSLHESILDEGEALRFERALKGASTLVRVSVAHRPEAKTTQMPLRLVA